MQTFVHGNICSGKTTFINLMKSLNANLITCVEDMTFLNPYVAHFNDLLSLGRPLTENEQIEFIELDVAAALQTFKHQREYKAGTDVIYERNTSESHHIFLPSIHKYITNDIVYSTIYDFQKAMMMFEPSGPNVKHVYMDKQPLTVL